MSAPSVFCVATDAALSRRARCPPPAAKGGAIARLGECEKQAGARCRRARRMALRLWISEGCFSVLGTLGNSQPTNLKSRFSSHAYAYVLGAPPSL